MIDSASEPQHGGLACASTLVVSVAVAVALTFVDVFLRHVVRGHVASWYDPDLMNRVSAVLFTASVFLPGSVLRRNGRHVVLMLMLALAVATVRVVGPESAESLLALVLSIWNPALLFVTITVAEFMLNRAFSIGEIRWSIGVGIAMAAVFFVIDRWIAWADWRIGGATPLGGIPVGGYYLREFVHWPLCAALAWGGVVLQERVFDSRSEGFRIGVAFAGLGVFAILACFIQLSVTTFASRSIHDGMPFRRAYGVRLLLLKPSAANREFVWEAVANDPWMEPLDADAEERDRLGDWRIVGVRRLDELDGADTARRLSARLRERPTAFLAQVAAPYLAQHRRCESLPLLLRFAYLGEDACVEALESLRVPQVVDVIMCEWFDAETAPGMPMDDTRTCPADHDWATANTRWRLGRLLGRDVGRTPREWIEAYRSWVESAPGGSCGPEQQKELDRVAAAMTKFLAAQHESLGPRARLILQRIMAFLREKGTPEQMNALTACVSQLTDSGSAELTDAQLAEVLRLASSIASDLFERARDSIAIPPPDFTVPSTTALETEVELYQQRVQEMRRSNPSRAGAQD